MELKEAVEILKKDIEKRFGLTEPQKALKVLLQHCEQSEVSEPDFYINRYGTKSTLIASSELNNIEDKHIRETYKGLYYKHPQPNIDLVELAWKWYQEGAVAEEDNDTIFTKEVFVKYYASELKDLK